MSYELYPLFSKPVYVKKLNIDCRKIVSLINKSFEQAGVKDNINSNVSNITSASKDKNVLDKKKFKFVKDAVLNELSFYTKEILRYTNKFKMTTSWFTKSEPNQQSNYHSHTNSMYSGVLYLQASKDSGNISFTDYRNNSMFNLIPKDYNVYNSVEYYFKTEPGLIIIFPSEMHHKILTNKSNTIRYSLAFNCIPIGNINHKNSDSFLKI